MHVTVTMGPAKTSGVNSTIAAAGDAATGVTATTPKAATITNTVCVHNNDVTCSVYPRYRIGLYCMGLNR